MAGEQTTTEATGGQPSGQSSSSQSSQSTQGAGSHTESTQSATTQNSTQQSQQQTAAEKPSRPDWLAENYWDGEKSQIKPDFGKHYQDLSTKAAADESRRLTLPKTPDEYKLELPSTFQVPQGIEFKLDDKNPLVPQARQLMHDIDQGKISGQEAFARIVELHAAGEIGRLQNMQKAVDAEIQKLGATGTARVSAVTDWLNGMLGEKMGKHMATMLVSAGHIEGFENLIRKFTSQGTGNFSQQHREADAPQTPSDEQWSKMTYSERRDYASRHQQPAQTNGRA